MEKKFLATISNEADNLYGVRFICSFLSQLSENRVTLLHICRLDSTGKSAKPNPTSGTPRDLPVETRKSIENAKKLLSDHGLPVDHVLTRTVAEKYGKVKDIIAESARGHYDAIVLGRRASHAFQWVFDRPADETFQSMIREHSCVSPLWICPDLGAGRKNVLLCIDGSESCYRAVDHVGHILASQAQHTITLLHVESAVGTECVEFFRRAEAILRGHSINLKRIKRTVIWSLSTSGTIISESKKGNYAVVALGMGDRKQARGNGRMAGPTTIKLISQLAKTSLWCCP